jgi:hypothetical protein
MSFTPSPTKIVRFRNPATGLVKAVPLNRAQRRRMGIKTKKQVFHAK